MSDNHAHATLGRSGMQTPLEADLGTAEPSDPVQDRDRRSAAQFRVCNSANEPGSDPRDEIPVLGFRNYWYPVATASKVPRRKPLRVKLLGDELCVFRGDTGIAVI